MEIKSIIIDFLFLLKSSKFALSLTCNHLEFWIEDIILRMSNLTNISVYSFIPDLLT